MRFGNDWAPQVEQAVGSQAEGAAPHDALLHTLCKCFHHSIQSYLPVSLMPSLPGELPNYSPHIVIVIYSHTTLIMYEPSRCAPHIVIAIYNHTTLNKYKPCRCAPHIVIVINSYTTLTMYEP